MLAYAQIRTPDGDVTDLGPGDIVGRMPSAKLRLNDPRVSEAHALVSLRGSTLRLLALRGRFFVDHAPQTDVELRPGVLIQLAQQLSLEVVAVSLPRHVLGLEGPGIARQILPALASLKTDAAELVPGFHPDADAIFWFDGHVHRVRLPRTDGDDTVLHPGDVITVRELDFRLVPIELERLESPVTERDDVLEMPLHITLRYETVHVRRGRDQFTIDGIPAVMLSELGIFGAPVEWRTVAHEIWPEEDETVSLRQRWDRGLARLRQRLHEVGLRGDLVRLLGGGRAELYLRPGDQVQDET